MVYDYIINNFKNGEPIFLGELPGESKDYLRQQMKKLVDEGKLERLYNGVYYLSYTTILGTKGRISVEKYIKKKIPDCGWENCWVYYRITTCQYVWFYYTESVLL